MKNDLSSAFILRELQQWREQYERGWGFSTTDTKDSIIAEHGPNGSRSSLHLIAFGEYLQILREIRDIGGEKALTNSA